MHELQLKLHSLHLTANFRHFFFDSSSQSDRLMTTISKEPGPSSAEVVARSARFIEAASARCSVVLISG